MNLDELLNKIKNSDELKSELQNALQSGDKQNVLEFMKKQGCNATLKEASEFLKQKAKEAQQAGEITPEELETASGGSLSMLLSPAIVSFVASAASAYHGWSLADASC